jgi:hypothetical protein
VRRSFFRLADPTTFELLSRRSGRLVSWATSNRHPSLN